MEQRAPLTNRMIFLSALVAVALAACALIAGTAQPAYAAVEPSIVMANGVDMKAHPGSETDPIRYDAATNTLTLENAVVDKPCKITTENGTYLYGVYANGDLTVRLLGSNSLVFPVYDENNAESWVTGIGLESQEDHDPYTGLVSGDGLLSTQQRIMRGVSCDGPLTVQSSTLKVQAHFECLLSDGALAIKGASLSFHMDYGTDDPLKAAHAIYQQNDATLSIASSDVTVDAPGDLSTAILSWGPITIDASNVSTSADNTVVYAGKENGTLTVANSTLTAASVTTTALKADNGMAFTGATTVEATSGNVYQPSAALYAYGTIAFALTGEGSVHASVPTNSIGRHDSDSAIYAAGFLTKDEDGHILLAEGNGLIEPVRGFIASWRDTDTDTVSAFVAQANGTDASSVTITASQVAHLAVQPDALAFKATVGYNEVESQAVTLSNTGTVTLHLAVQPTTLFSTDLPADATLAPGQTLAVTLKPVQGLSAGSHSEAVSFTASEGAQAAVGCSFEVAPAPQPTPQPDPHRRSLAPTGDQLGLVAAALAGAAVVAAALILLIRKHHKNR